ncbi:uncharacterized protein N7446_005255 [Penicillium canescens]|uniref:Uncharacterized protein n=1 Tax=Penicillium canescens TaxID=5083 RepID=A0AAD6I9K6_PENCN|nr:uncharacterized protein N7446_005225 [Penicillium canescens]XP_058375332.1 uncharacterized protein N7446_005255 [Penicillium canescens]KAJ6038426.1 hypothetical protein N7460_008197 [Penicillium canescens]KAJ6038452.1 hypothetical protein N7460_008223 [Penicillium canescens]KAJ6068188.1 hypothetical protein N7446_005225 [Penicillium canescens]KAJ6068218.1 hypothetical protein N7446_005255 [Penicillium canescens]
MEIQLTFCQKLTRKLQHILGDNLSKSSIPNTLPRAESTSDTLDAALEWERIRRSAAPSPELLSKECQRQKIHPDSHELPEDKDGKARGCSSTCHQTGQLLVGSRAAGQIGKIGVSEEEHFMIGFGSFLGALAEK